MKKTKVVLGVIGSDCHAVGNKILDYALTDAGFDVVNIGVLCPQEDFINAALETNADAILISSLYGQGELDCQGMRQKCDEAGLKGIKLFVGGNNALKHLALTTFIRQELQLTQQSAIYVPISRIIIFRKILQSFVERIHNLSRIEGLT